MPLAHEAITGRRFCDNEVSRIFGARKCGTHSPTPARPGPISDELRKGFDLAGYPLLTRGLSSRGLIEVYPHPALVELTGASERLPYKTPKTRSYWPSLTPTERRARLYQQWNEIINLLEGEIANVSAVLPIPGMTATKAEAKACEDMLDAIICAWVAVCALEGRARPLGDENSAIWIPISASSFCAENCKCHFKLTRRSWLLHFELNVGALDERQRTSKRDLNVKTRHATSMNSGLHN